MPSASQIAGSPPLTLHAAVKSKIIDIQLEMVCPKRYIGHSGVSGDNSAATGTAKWRWT